MMRTPSGVAIFASASHERAEVLHEQTHALLSAGVHGRASVAGRDCDAIKQLNDSGVIGS
jgi:hypothetical protein